VRCLQVEAVSRCDPSVGCSSGNSEDCYPPKSPGLPDELAKGARLTPYGRPFSLERMAQQGMRAEEAAKAAGGSVRTAYKWLRRFREVGAAGRMDRFSRPHVYPHATPMATVAQALERRRARQTYRTIAHNLVLAPGTVGRLLQRAGLNRLSALEPANRSATTNTKHPVTCWIWISKNSAVSGVPGIGAPATARSPPGC
jgi:transposase